AVAHLAQQGLLLLQQLLGMFEQPLFLLISDSTLGNVLDGEEDHSACPGLVANGQGVELNCPLAQMREVLLEFEALDRRMPRNDARQQLAQARYVPLTT